MDRQVVQRAVRNEDEQILVAEIRKRRVDRDLREPHPRLADLLVPCIANLSGEVLLHAREEVRGSALPLEVNLAPALCAHHEDEQLLFGQVVGHQDGVRTNVRKRCFEIGGAVALEAPHEERGSAAFRALERLVQLVQIGIESDEIAVDVGEPRLDSRSFLRPENLASNRLANGDCFLKHGDRVVLRPCLLVQPGQCRERGE